MVTVTFDRAEANVVVIKRGVTVDPLPHGRWLTVRDGHEKTVALIDCALPSKVLYVEIT